MNEKGIRAWVTAAAAVIGANWWNVSNRIDDRARDILETVERRHESGRLIDALAEDAQTLIGDVGYIKGVLDADRQKSGPAD